MLPRKGVIWLLMSIGLLIDIAAGQNYVVSAPHSDQSTIKDVQVACQHDSIVITLHAEPEFNGLIYPKGLARNSSCMAEYSDVQGVISYSMPLRSCNTMSTDVNDGVEYFNTVVVQPHRRLVTNQGRGFHIRCRYHTKDKTISAGGVNISDLNSLPYDTNGDLPGCSMKIYIGDENTQLHQAENVKIGDELRMVMAIDAQPVYGMKVTDCLVRDGLNWGDQQLINDHGCSVDRELMPELEYSEDKMMATVRFQAHKFPYTSSVYYQCNVKLCMKEAGGCDDVPPLCTSDGRNIRRRRQLDPVTEISQEGNIKDLNEADPQDLSVSVFSGLHVNDPEDEAAEEFETTSQPAQDDQAFCISPRLFAIIMAIAGIILMVAVILLVVCLVQRRRRKEVSTTAGSSIYSGPYSNHAYSST